MTKLKWQLARDMQYRQECWITGHFCLLIEPTDKTLAAYRVAIIRGAYSPALYRSQRSWPEAEAKAEAVKAGRKVAMREALIHSKIASILKAEVTHA